MFRRTAAKAAPLARRLAALGLFDIQARPTVSYSTKAAAFVKRINREKKGPLAGAFYEEIAAIPRFEGVTACALLERLPVILPEPPKWEVDYLLWHQEREKLKAKDTSEYLEQILSENRPTTRSEDDEELSRAERLYEAASRETEADVANDHKSLNRKLDQRLFLLVKEKGKDWGFLSASHEASEPLRRTAERAVGIANAAEKYVYFVGNVPCAHWPSEETLRAAHYNKVRDHEKQQLMPRYLRLQKQREAAGMPGAQDAIEKGHVKGQFFFRAQLIAASWDVDPSKYEDYAWVTAAEFSDYLSDSRLSHTLSYFIDERLHVDGP
mmetsp:Transcript_6214/g.22879  ORF Transcript_6214/g.22879 Transcript_6214/m.22879 type:complete len:325 (+) Transcript_6214:130-1104(+)